jgi:hypothetical protein
MAVQQPSNIASSTAKVTTGQSDTGATIDVAASKEGTATRSNPDKVQKPEYEIDVFPNPLEEFASVTPVWTLACLSPDQFNNPSSYRVDGGLKNIVMSSAGRFDSDRVGTFYGTPEYYINNFTMRAVIAANEKTGNTNAFKFEWDIYEPYSMGLLLQSLQVAARASGYVNYLDNCPYVLRLDFKGFDEMGVPLSTIKPKFFVMKLVSVKFQVTEAGSSYKMEGVPYNHQGYSDEINITYKDIKLIADDKTEGTVQELLQTGTRSLKVILNENERLLVKEGLVGIPDEYDIVFAETSSDPGSSTPPSGSENRATVDPKSSSSSRSVGSSSTVSDPPSVSSNDIAKSTFGFSQSKGGNFIFKKYGDQVDEKTGIVKRDNMSIDPKNRSFLFSQGQTIISMINQIILSSEYAKKAIIPQADGFIRWWKVDVQVKLLEFDDSTADFAKKFIFRIVPFLVHHTVFSNPNSAPIGYDKIQKKLVKKYSYIYTGENIDVIRFDININNLFYSGTNPSPENKTDQASNQDDSGPVQTQNLTVKTGEGASPNAKVANLGRKRIKRDPKLLESMIKGGAGIKDTQQKVAESFHSAFVNGTSADLIKVDLEILGDPYWMVDSGFANYFSESADPTDQINSDNTMNYESGDVFVYLNFRTPADVNETNSLYDFPSLGKESPFSGIYRVISCESQFNEGQFKQKLGCIRMPGQAIEFKDAPPEAKSQTVDAANSPPRTFGEPEPEAISPIDNIEFTRASQAGEYGTS